MLAERLQEDLKDAMRAKDEQKLSIIRMLKSAIQYYEINKGGAGYVATDEDIIDVIGKEIKKRRESIELYIRGERPELADKEKSEIEVLQTYLPEQLSEEVVRSMIDEAISQSGATEMKDMGKVMRILNPQIKGKADGGFVSSLVREKLTS
jgi:uncharacterized protein YqeY